MSPTPSIAIIGTVGVPARYGGFETLAEALVTAAEAAGRAEALTVYCSTPQSPTGRPATFRGARLDYLPLPGPERPRHPVLAMGRPQYRVCRFSVVREQMGLRGRKTGSQPAQMRVAWAAEPGECEEILAEVRRNPNRALIETILQSKHWIRVPQETIS